MAAMGNTGINTGSTVYEPLLVRLREQIQTGRVGPGEYLGSEYDMVRQTGLSRVSVRRAIGHLVKEGLVERRAGKGLFVRAADRATRTIQIVVPDLTWDRCVKTVRGIKAAAQRQGIFCQIHDAHDNLDMDIDMIRRLPERHSDGAIIIGLHERKFTPVLYELHANNYPFVLIDQQLEDLDIPTVLADNYGGGYHVGLELMQRGHFRIGFIGMFRPHTGRARMEGLRDAINDAGFSFDRSLAIDIEGEEDVSDWRKRQYRYTQDLLKRKDRPTAVFIQSDATAMVSYRAIKDLGMKIPDDVAIVGFDDDPASQWLDPPLATVSQQAELIGKTAVDLVRRRLENPEGPAEHKVIETVWVPRESAGKVNL